jgi:heat shock protein HtpX
MTQRLSFEDEISRNKIKSFFLMAIVFIIIIFLGGLISLAVNPGYFFIFTIIATIFSMGYILIGYYASDKIALASVHAQLADKNQFKALYSSVENMSLASGLPMPKVYVMQSEQINAFASGRDPNHAVICVTTGTLRKLNKDELEGVIAHEMSHIANFDIRFMTITAVLVGMASIISQLFLRSLWFSNSDRDNKRGAGIFIVLAIVAAIIAPLLAQLVQQQ